MTVLSLAFRRCLSQAAFLKVLFVGSFNFEVEKELARLAVLVQNLLRDFAILKDSVAPARRSTNLYSGWLDFDANVALRPFRSVQVTGLSALAWKLYHLSRKKGPQNCKFVFVFVLQRFRSPARKSERVRFWIIALRIRRKLWRDRAAVCLGILWEDSVGHLQDENQSVQAGLVVELLMRSGIPCLRRTVARKSGSGLNSVVSISWRKSTRQRFHKASHDSCIRF